ncbi:MAG: hypothetical protein KC777_23830 [Cyanobacteria bacterium HKST-UBA02]|nr:hypothetical protein [Cyanobacteria bacterium HKST-UBA02]
MIGFAVVFIVPMSIAALLGSFANKRHAPEFDTKPTSAPLAHQISAILTAVAVTYLTAFALHCGLIAVTGAKTILGPGTYSAPLILVGTSFEFSGMWATAGLAGAVLAIACNEVLTFMRVERDRFKMVAFAAGISPILMFLASVVLELLSSTPAELHLLFIGMSFMLQFSIVTGVLTATGTLYILNQRLRVRKEAKTEN